MIFILFFIDVAWDLRFWNYKWLVIGKFLENQIFVTGIKPKPKLISEFSNRTNRKCEPKSNRTKFIHVLKLIGLNSPTWSSCNPNRNSNNSNRNLICPPLLKIEVNPRNGHMLKLKKSYCTFGFWYV